MVPLRKFAALKIYDPVGHSPLCSTIYLQNYAAEKIKLNKEFQIKKVCLKEIGCEIASITNSIHCISHLYCTSFSSPFPSATLNNHPFLLISSAPWLVLLVTLGILQLLFPVLCFSFNTFPLPFFILLFPTSPTSKIFLARSSPLIT